MKPPVRLAAAALLAAPLAAFALAKYAGRWRPVAVGEVPLETTGFSAHVEASGDIISVVAQTNYGVPLETAHFGASGGALLPRRGMPTGAGRWLWQICEADEQHEWPRRILLREKAGVPPLLLDVPDEVAWPSHDFGRLWLVPGVRVQLVVRADYLCWRLDDLPAAPDGLPPEMAYTPPIAPRHLKMARNCWGHFFAPDGQSLLTDSVDELWRLSTQTGEVLSRTPLEAQQDTNSWGFSP